MPKRSDKPYYGPAVLLFVTVAALAYLSWTYPWRVPLWVREEAGLASVPNLPIVPAAIALEGLFALQMAAYCWSLWRARRSDELPGVRLVLGTVGLCLVLYLASGPLLQSDFSLYDGYARMSLQGVNPYVHAPSQFTDDAINRHNFFWSEPDPYGPVWTMLWTPLAALAGDHFLIAMALGRLLGAAFYLLGVALIMRLGGGWSWAALAFAWNPLVLQEALANGRIDVAMAVLLLAVLVCVQRGRWLLGAAALALAVSVRFTAVIAVPFYAVALLRRPGTRVQRIAWTVTAMALLAAVVAAAYAPYWAGLATFGGIIAAGLRYGNATLSSVIMKLLLSQAPDARHSLGWMLATIPAGALAVGWLRLGRHARATDTRLAVDLLLASILYLWLVSPHLGAWYAAWPIVLAVAAGAHTAEGEEVWIAAALSVWGLGLYAVWQILILGAADVVGVVYELALLAWPVAALALYVARRMPWLERMLPAGLAQQNPAQSP